jgi:ABC-2 type transport system ATP-binding protein
VTVQTDQFEVGASAAIQLRDLTKVYGQTRALDNVNLTVAAGSVFGFLGPNGAGKTTTLRILAGLAAPTAGQANILGRNISAADNELRALIGYLPDVPAFYPWMTASEFLHFTGELFGLAGSDVEQRIEALLDLAGLSAVTTRVGSYSRGMKQRLGIAQALMNAPHVLLLDEPTSALDPLGRKEVLDMIAALAGRTTVFFSTHILSDVERVCDTVAILDHGQVVREAPIDELKAGHGGGQRLLIAVDQPAPLVAALRGQSWLTSIEPGDEAGELRLAVSDLAAAQRALPAAVAAAGLALRRLDVNELSLEDVFVELVGERSGDNIPHPQS